MHHLGTAGTSERIVADMHISLELIPAEGDRLEGRALADDGRGSLTFSGTLDLLRVIEELRHTTSDGAGHPAAASRS